MVTVRLHVGCVCGSCFLPIPWCPSDVCLVPSTPVHGTPVTVIIPSFIIEQRKNLWRTFYAQKKDFGHDKTLVCVPPGVLPSQFFLLNVTPCSTELTADSRAVNCLRGSCDVSPL